jgi:hypothetical protein
MVRDKASGLVLVAVAVPVCYCQKYSYFPPFQSLALHLQLFNDPVKTDTGCYQPFFLLQLRQLRNH